MESIRLLKEQQKKMRDEKARIQKELRNAEKRRRRLKKRARQLTDDDLVEVLQMRKTVEDTANRDINEAGHSEGSSSSSCKD
jgi:predicted nuclease with TOPRIM domain